jgi:hypothetical protein
VQRRTRDDESALSGSQESAKCQRGFSPDIRERWSFFSDSRMSLKYHPQQFSQRFSASIKSPNKLLESRSTLYSWWSLII